MQFSRNAPAFLFLRFDQLPREVSLRGLRAFHAAHPPPINTKEQRPAAKARQQSEPKRLPPKRQNCHRQQTLKMKPFEAVPISPELGAVTPLSGERKVLPPKRFRKSAHCSLGIHTAILIHEPLFVY